MAAVNDIDACLPQTQCGECGYSGCLPYAQALSQGTTTIDRCPPGGVTTLEALAKVLHVDAQPYMEAMIVGQRKPAVAVIREAECIGCTKCIQACPVDAVVGSAKQMHTVLPYECTGCGLCVEPCPVDCIDLVLQPELLYDPDTARARHQAKHVRWLHEEQAREQSYREKRQIAALTEDKLREKQAKQDYILQALARKKAKTQDKHDE